MTLLLSLKHPFPLHFNRVLRNHTGKVTKRRIRSPSIHSTCLSSPRSQQQQQQRRRQSSLSAAASRRRSVACRRRSASPVSRSSSTVIRRASSSPLPPSFPSSFLARAHCLSLVPSAFSSAPSFFRCRPAVVNICSNTDTYLHNTRVLHSIVPTARRSTTQQPTASSSSSSLSATATPPDGEFTDRTFPFFSGDGRPRERLGHSALFRVANGH
jgi:hypothetical protein